MSLPEPNSSSAALVTGASAGIGGEIAKLLAARGYSLVLVARRKDRLVALADELAEAHGIRIETNAADLSKPTPRARIAERIEELGLEVDVLVNNAGFATGGAFHRADPARELEQVRVLVEAPVALTSAFVPAMVERSRGARALARDETPEDLEGTLVYLLSSDSDFVTGQMLVVNGGAQFW